MYIPASLSELMAPSPLLRTGLLFQCSCSCWLVLCKFCQLSCISLPSLICLHFFVPSKQLSCFTALVLFTCFFLLFFFFKSIITTIRNSLDVLSSYAPASTELTFHGRSISHFRPVTEGFVRHTILSFPSETCELEAFPVHLLSKCLDTLLSCITAAFNNSLVSGVFLSVCKSALVKPLLKKKMSLDPSKLKNYHPVSNLPFPSKILERIILSQLNEYLNHNNLLSRHLSEYRPNHSTETALFMIFNDLLTALDNNRICILILLDLSAAFDTIDHQIRLTRL